MKIIKAFSVLLAFLNSPACAAELKVFFGNLHSHTSYSDGSGTPHPAVTQWHWQGERLIGHG